MDTQQNRVNECRFRGRLSRQPELAATMAGVPVCRLIIVDDAAGPASAPVRVGLYMIGAQAKRCFSGLREGDLVEAVGELRSRLAGKPPKYPEVLVGERFEDVKLRQRAAAATA